MKHHAPNPQESGRLIVAAVVSLIILLGFHVFYEKPRMEAAQSRAAAVAEQQAAPVAVAKGADEERDTAPRLQIRGAKVGGSLSLKGLRLDHVTLNEHYATVEKKENVALLTPSWTGKGFYAETGWIASNVSLPGKDTLWTVKPGSPDVLETGKPVTLVWDNGQGLVFEREIAVDDEYLFTVTQRVTNNTGSPVTLHPYELVARHSLPVDYRGMYIVHEGPIGWIGGEMEEPSYKDLRKGKKIEKDTIGGWAGITDHYWLVAMIPQQDQTMKARMIGTDPEKEKEFYQVDLTGPALTVSPGGTGVATTHLFTGGKTLDALDRYEDELDVPHLDLALDFGMWFFITRPLFYALTFLGHYFGNIAIGILLLTVILRALVFPLASKSFRSMADMKRVAPELKKIQEKYRDDRQKMQQEIMGLYQREKVNPFSGCWPILVQIPIFFALYKVIQMALEVRHAPFWGWIDDLSAPDPTSIFNLFGLIPWDPPAFLQIGAWPVLFCITMIFQKRLTPPMPDPVQEKVQSFFPFFITYLLAHFASGLVIYWTWSNVLGIVQQYYIMRRAGTDVHLIKGHADRRKKKAKK